MNLSNIELFLLDMDGTIYLENALIDGAKAFLLWLQQNNKEYCFVTNNSSKSQQAYLNKLAKLDISCRPDQIFTSGMAMGLYLKKEFPQKSVYLVGTQSLAEELIKDGIVINDENPDIVVVGYDSELTYEKLRKACHFLRDGATFLATNVDVVYPLAKNAFIPDCGSFCHMLEVATQKKPYYIGKPNPLMMHLLAQNHHIDMEKIAVVGDRIYTDVAWAIAANATSILVLSGETTQEVLEKSPIKPNFVFSSVKELLFHLEKEQKG